jgi:hypothetical protein
LNNSSKREQGLLPLDKPLKYTVNQKDHQISKMQYALPTEGRNAMGDVIELHESWHGLIQTRRGEEAQQVTLDRDWVEENTDTPFRKFLQEIRIKDGHRGFVLIPEGDNEAHVDGTITFVSNAPCVKYHSTSQAKNKRRCVLEDAASGLHFLGFHRLRVLVAATVNSKTIILNPMGYLQDRFENRGWINWKRKRYNLYHWDRNGKRHGNLCYHPMTT